MIAVEQMVLLEKWLRHFKKGDHPAAIVMETDTRIGWWIGERFKLLKDEFH